MNLECILGAYRPRHLTQKSSYFVKIQRVMIHGLSLTSSEVHTHSFYNVLPVQLKTLQSSTDVYTQCLPK